MLIIMILTMKTMITMTTMTMMLILIMMIGGMKMLLPNLNNQRVKIKRVLKAKRALKTMTMSQNLQRVNHQRVHHLINPFSLATMITTINLGTFKLVTSLKIRKTCSTLGRLKATFFD